MKKLGNEKMDVQALLDEADRNKDGVIDYEGMKNKQYIMNMYIFSVNCPLHNTCCFKLNIIKITRQAVNFLK